METASSAGSSLAEALFGKSSRADEVWQEVRFDSPNAFLEARRGEVTLEALDQVEDTKGNNGVVGELTLTNLRIIWVNKKVRRTNISVGLGNITSLSVLPANSRLKGSCSSLYVLTRLNQQRFEFIFTALADTSSSLPSMAMALLAAFDASRPYRELKLRGALLVDNELQLLPREVAYSRVNGVWNLSSEAGNLGTFYITNCRVVWFSSMSNAFNVSIPLLQVKAVKVCNSAKFGVALVIETSPQSGGYVLGFKVDPRETLDYVHKELSSLLQAYTNDPIYGVEYDVGAAIDVVHAPAARPEDESDVVETVAGSDAWAAYCADGDVAGEGREPVYSSELGLAMETPRDGASIQQLWGIL